MTGSQSNPGWYMHATHQAQNPGKSQGSDFYVQYRIRRANRPGPPPDNRELFEHHGESAWPQTPTTHTWCRSLCSTASRWATATSPPIRASEHLRPPELRHAAEPAERDRRCLQHHGGLEVLGWLGHDPCSLHPRDEWRNGSEQNSHGSVGEHDPALVPADPVPTQRFGT